MHKRGDTLVEVMFAVGIFGMVAIGAISLMNRGLATAQSTLETSMARQEIDAQAEALRFIRDGYIGEVGGAVNGAAVNCSSSSFTSYRELWYCIKQQAYAVSEIIAEDDKFYTRGNASGQACSELFQKDGAFYVPQHAFVINPRALNSTSNFSNIIKANTASGGVFYTAATYPRLIYGDANADVVLSDAEIDAGLVTARDYSSLSQAEGIWVTAVESESQMDGQPEYYDFYIQTCWDSVASNSASTISSTIRLFNPDMVPATSEDD